MTTRLDHVRAEVTDLAELLESVPEADWDRETACAGFRVRDVVSHLVLAREPVPASLLLSVFRGPAAVTRLAGRVSVEQGSARSPHDLLEGLRRVAVHPRAGLLGRVDPVDNMLADHATHVQDVRFGLDLRVAPAPERACAVLRAAVRLWRPITWGTRERARGLRLEASDVDWSWGDGPVVRGPYDALLLALGGRSAGLAHLTGEGVDHLAGRQPAAV